MSGDTEANDISKKVSLLTFPEREAHCITQGHVGNQPYLLSRCKHPVWGNQWSEPFWIFREMWGGLDRRLRDD